MARGNWRINISRIGFALWVMLSVAGLVAAQEAPPDYSVRSIRYEFSENGTRVTVIFDVLNNGGAAGVAATARLLDGSGRPFTEAPIAPLAQFESAPVRLEFPTYLFQDNAGESVSLTATVGIPEIEQPSSPNVGDNNARISVPIPILDVVVPSEFDTAEAQTAPPNEITLESVLSGIPINVFGAAIDSRVLIAGGLVVFGILLVVVWIVVAILRALFTRPLVFPTWQPPYSANTYLDPNSLPGRRALWQPHAGSDLLPMPCQQGSFAARKLLIGAQGAKLGGWRVTGLRLNQYDMYGRVTRSQVIAEPRWVKRLDNAARASGKLNVARAEGKIRPIAGRMIRDLKKRVHKRSAMLPIAMDVRFNGRHGDVRIVFELHQCDGSAYIPVDTWEPQMVVTTSGGMIRENVTYTLFGQREDEKSRAYYQRLRTDMTRTLAHLFAGATQTPPAVKGGGRNKLPPTPPSTPTMPPETSMDTAPVTVVEDATPPGNPVI